MVHSSLLLVCRLAVDHNHKTGRVRGLLCSNCNMALGCIKEDIKILNKMVEHLNVV